MHLHTEETVLRLAYTPISFSGYTPDLLKANSYTTLMHIFPG